MVQRDRCSLGSPSDVYCDLGMLQSAVIYCSFVKVLMWADLDPGGPTHRFLHIYIDSLPCFANVGHVLPCFAMLLDGSDPEAPRLLRASLQTDQGTARVPLA